MGGNNLDWLEQVDEDQDGVVIEDLVKKEEEIKKNLKRNRPGSRGKKPVDTLEYEIRPRSSDGMLVLFQGQGPRKGKTISIPLRPAIWDLIENLTIGSKTQVCAALIEKGLTDLLESGDCLLAKGIKK